MFDCLSSEGFNGLVMSSILLWSSSCKWCPIKIEDCCDRIDFLELTFDSVDACCFASILCWSLLDLLSSVAGVMLTGSFFFVLIFDSFPSFVVIYCLFKGVRGGIDANLIFAQLKYIKSLRRMCFDGAKRVLFTLFFFVFVW